MYHDIHKKYQAAQPKMFLEHQIIILEWCLEDHVTLKTGVMMLWSHILWSGKCSEHKRHPSKVLNVKFCTFKLLSDWLMQCTSYRAAALGEWLQQSLKPGVLISEELCHKRVIQMLLIVKSAQFLYIVSLWL